MVRIDVPGEGPAHARVAFVGGVRGGRGWIHHNGYRWIYADGRKVQEHRHVMECALGRKLHVDEVVHHKNEDKLDNRLENLEVISRANHTSHHRPKRRLCALCGKDDPHQSRGLCAPHANTWRYRARKLADLLERICQML